MRRVRFTHAVKMDSPYMVADEGAEQTLPDYVANFAVHHGNAIYLDADPLPGPSRAELEKQEEAIQAGTLKQIDDEPGEEVKKPYGNAPKSAWVRYACAVDDKMTEERAEGMTKADLMSRYGERLLGYAE